MTPITAFIIGASAIFLGTTLGSLAVFFFKKNFSDAVNTLVLGFASGVMLSTSIFGLLIPASEEVRALDFYQHWEFVPIVVGFLLGCLILYLLDILIPHIHLSTNSDEGVHREKYSKQTKFFIAITLHNIPEGLSVGFAAGLALSSTSGEYVTSLLALSLAIAIQNIPEGAAVSIPYYGLGVSKPKSFLLGTLTGVVEPLFAIIGLFIASWFAPLMPWLLSLAAGMMIYVTLDEILPESISGKLSHYGVWSFIVGFMVMLILEMVL